MRLRLAALAIVSAMRAAFAAPATKSLHVQGARPPRAAARPDVTTPVLPPSRPSPVAPQPSTAGQPARLPAPPPAVPPRRFGRFNLDMPFAQVRAMPELRGCAEALTSSSGRAECAVTLPQDADRIERVQLAWEEGRNGPELSAMRLVFDPQLAPALTDLEWQLTRGWGPPSLEQLRRDRDQKFFTLQWEDAEHRATVEAQGTMLQPSRAIAVVLERRAMPLTGELSSLHPRPFPGFRVRSAWRIEFDGQTHALIWGTSLTPAQEAMGELSAVWATQRNYVGVWKLEPAAAARPRRWKPLWERTTGGEDDEDGQEPQRILYVESRDVTGDGTPDIEVALTCETCGSRANELLVKTVRAGKLVDLLSKRDLYRAQVDLGPGQVRIREPEGEDDQGSTVSTYSYDRGKGAFVLAREERAPAPSR